MYQILYFLTDISDSQRALEILERIQDKLHDCSDTSHEDDLENLIYMLESPLFSQILNIQDALTQLKQVATPLVKILILQICRLTRCIHWC